MNEGGGAKRADAVRNARTVLDAAAAVFVESGVDAPIRRIASRAGVGIATIYRHYPTRQDLIVAVYRHQVEACAAAAPELLESSPSAVVALRSWAQLFVEFLITKHGLASAMSSGEGQLAGLHSYFLDRLVPACDQILEAGVAAQEFRPGFPAALVLRGIGNLCVTSRYDQGDETQTMVDVFLDGLTVFPQRT